MINHHDLINMPGYGNAEKELRKAGMWHVATNDTERLVVLSNLIGLAYSYVTDKYDVFFEFSQVNEMEWFRGDIDGYATQKAMESTT